MSLTVGSKVKFVAFGFRGGESIETGVVWRLCPGKDYFIVRRSGGVCGRLGYRYLREVSVNESVTWRV